MVLESEEESLSPNLVRLLTAAKDFIGNPDVCICMDSGALSYDSLWLTSSLRGVINMDLTVEAGAQGYHSGELGGIMPETFRVMRELLSRVDNSGTGVCCAELQPEIPASARKEAETIAKSSGNAMYKDYKLCKNVKYMNQTNLKEMYLANTWRPGLAITGADGLPTLGIAGNVVR